MQLSWVPKTGAGATGGFETRSDRGRYKTAVECMSTAYRETSDERETYNTEGEHEWNRKARGKTHERLDDELSH